MTVERLLGGPLPSRVAGVLALMTSLEQSLPERDGVVHFLRLYRAVTEAVDEAARPGGDLGDPRFLRWLDVVFANYFFRTLREALSRPAAVPRAWAPLLEARASAEVLPLQFALAGMNAHINRDLPLALVETWSALDVEPRVGGPEHRAYTAVNALLEAVEARVKAQLLTEALGHVDRSLGRVDDVLAMWKVSKAREAAWANAETLWALRGVPRLRTDFERALDGMVGFAGRGLLRAL